MNRKSLHILKFLCLLLLVLGMAGQSPLTAADSVFFRYPMRTAPEMSGSFAELRPNHFHGGMDLRTEQREGLKVYSAAPGFIVRVGVSKVSYGKVLYVEHANGMTTVYAHLSKFCAPVQKLVKRQQRKSKQYETDLRGLHIATKKNKPIALSGNSGSSGGPHLHFEVRQDSLRLNPALYGIQISDSMPPAVLYLALYSQNTSLQTENTLALPDTDSLLQVSFMDCPQTDYAMQRAIRSQYDSIENLRQRLSDTLYANTPAALSLPKTIGGTEFTARYFHSDNLPDTLYLHGQTAFGICALDSIQRMPFHYGLYKLLFAIEQGNGQVDTLAYYCLDALSFRTCDALNQHIDLPFYNLTKKRLEKSYLEDGQSATPYRVMSNRGVFVPQSGSSYTLIVTMEDVAGNRHALRIPLVSK
ncbi:MAG: M23 family metallopeptidase [Lentimicrobiaceae bacterium]|nr:M23 family metallopeptidase [Lentimicrobiaceae bacterium]